MYLRDLSLFKMRGSQENYEILNNKNIIYLPKRLIKLISRWAAGAIKK